MKKPFISIRITVCLLHYLQVACQTPDPQNPDSWVIVSEQGIIGNPTLSTGENISMKTLMWLLMVFVGLLGCVESTPDPAFSGDTRATLNGQAWGGFSTAWKNPNDSCGINTVNLSIQNKLSYPKARLQAPALCSGYCGDQSLSFTRIPLAVGVYTLATHQPCATNTNQVGVGFTTLIGGDVIRDQYQPDLTKTGRLRITKYDPKGGEIEGTFDISLVRDNRRQTASDAAENIHFQNGTFKTKLP